jgi:GNAT superfamily N-acetyltransferase
MRFSIRPWRDEDTDFYVALRRAWDPTTGEDQLRRTAAGEGRTHLHRSVAEIDGQQVGFVQISVMPFSDQAQCLVLVAPEHRAKGIGTALFDSGIEAVSGRELGGFIWDSDVTSLRAAQNWGFAITSHAIESHLAAKDADLTEPAAPGYRLQFADDAELTDTDATALDEMMARSSTHPEAVELGWNLATADYRKLFHGLLWSIVWDGPRVVAMANTHPQHDADWSILFTSTDPDYRGRGLARVAKQLLHRNGFARGASGFATWNEERNEGIRALNRSMGYVATAGEYRLKREATAA